MPDAPPALRTRAMTTVTLSAVRTLARILEIVNGVPLAERPWLIRNLRDALHGSNAGSNAGSPRAEPPNEPPVQTQFEPPVQTAVEPAVEPPVQTRFEQESLSSFFSEFWSL